MYVLYVVYVRWSFGHGGQVYRAPRDPTEVPSGRCEDANVRLVRRPLQDKGFEGTDGNTGTFFFFFSHTFYFPVSAQSVVTGVVPSPPRFLPSIFIAHRVQYSHCSSIFHRVLLTHALALSASQFELKKKSQRIYTSMHSAGLELTKLTYTRLEDNLIRHRGDRIAATGTINSPQSAICGCSRLFQAILHAL